MPDPGALAVEPRAGNAQRRPPPATERPPRVGIHRAGRRSGRLHLPAEVYQHDREDLRGKAELIIAKQRNGPTGVAELIFIKDYTKFENAAGDVGEEPPPAPDDE